MNTVSFHERDICDNCNKIFTTYSLQSGKIYHKCIKCVLENVCWDNKHHKIPCEGCINNHHGLCQHCVFQMCEHKKPNVERVYNKLLRKHTQFRVYPEIQKTHLIDEILDNPDICIIC